MDDFPLDLSGPPIDFAAYHFDPHTLLAVLLLCLAIAALFVTALIPDKRQMRKREAFRRVLAWVRVKRLQRQKRRKSKGIKK